MITDVQLDASDHEAKVFAGRALMTLAETGIVASRILKGSGHSILSDNAAMLVALHIWLSGPTRPSTLAEDLDMTTGASTKVVTRLEGAGLVVRHPDPTDGRAVMVHLTDDGRSAIDTVMTDLVPVMERTVKHLDALHTLSE